MGKLKRHNIFQKEQQQKKRRRTTPTPTCWTKSSQTMKTTNGKVEEKLSRLKQVGEWYFVFNIIGIANNQISMGMACGRFWMEEMGSLQIHATVLDGLLGPNECLHARARGYEQESIQLVSYYK